MVFYALMAAVACFGFWLYRRKAGKSKTVVTSAWLLLGSGGSWAMRQVTKEGFMLYDGPCQYPVSDCVLADVDSKLGVVFVLAASSVALVDYEQFSKMKQSSIKGALLKPQSDLGQLLTMIGAVAVICAAIYNFQQSGQVNANLISQQAQLDRIVEAFDNGLEVKK